MLNHFDTSSYSFLAWAVIPHYLSLPAMVYMIRGEHYTEAVVRSVIST